MRIHLGRFSYLATADKNKEEQKCDDFHRDAPVISAWLNRKESIPLEELAEPIAIV